MAKTEQPGCWVASELVEKIQMETKASDSGEAARLERAARTVAILRGLGYAGAYIGGTHKADHIRWIIKRGEFLAPKWEEYAEELTYAPKNAFYLYQPSTAVAKPKRLAPRIVNAISHVLSPSRIPPDGTLRRLLVTASRWI